MKKSMILFSTVVFCLFLLTSFVHANVINLTKHKMHGLKSESKGLMRGIVHRDKEMPGLRSKGKNWGRSLSIVKLSGKTNHFGIDITTGDYISYYATVPDVKVWIAEYPFTKYLDIRTDENGWWTMYIIKYRGIDLEFSFVYEKEGWVTTKTNVITVTDEDNTDLAIQYIDPYYYYIAMKPAVESMMAAMGLPGVLENALVVTVGKSWASMHDDTLPHGDPGAVVHMTPFSDQAIGPLYFNEAVQPDITYTATSVDGGVAWLNVPSGQTYYVTAEKPGVEYETVEFRIDETDAENGIELYIASPPDSVQGDNDSGPGQD